LSSKHIHGVDDTRDPSKNGQTDVDQEISTTSALQEDTQRRQDDGEDDLADVSIEDVSTPNIRILSVLRATARLGGPEQRGWNAGTENEKAGERDKRGLRTSCDSGRSQNSKG
jgi:hypothetical protein